MGSVDASVLSTDELHEQSQGGRFCRWKLIPNEDSSLYSTTAVLFLNYYFYSFEVSVDVSTLSMGYADNVLVNLFVDNFCESWWR